jgi:hypothetical protein
MISEDCFLVRKKSAWRNCGAKSLFCNWGRKRKTTAKELKRKWVQQGNSFSCFLYNSVYVKETE